MSTEVERRESFPTLASVAVEPLNTDASNPLATLPRLLLVAQRRAAWLADALADQVAREGVGGVVGDQLAIDGGGAPVKVSEYARTLADLEARERATAERISATMARLGVDSAKIGSDQAALIAGSLRRFAEANGIDWAAPEVRRYAQRAVLEAHAAMKRGTA